MAREPRPGVGRLVTHPRPVDARHRDLRGAPDHLTDVRARLACAMPWRRPAPPRPAADCATGRGQRVRVRDHTTVTAGVHPPPRTRTGHRLAAVLSVRPPPPASGAQLAANRFVEPPARALPAGTTSPPPPTRPARARLAGTRSPACRGSTAAWRDSGHLLPPPTRTRVRSRHLAQLLRRPHVGSQAGPNLPRAG